MGRVSASAAAKDCGAAPLWGAPFAFELVAGATVWSCGMGLSLAIPQPSSGHTSPYSPLLEFQSPRITKSNSHSL